MSRTVLFAGGPLHGQTMVTGNARTVAALEPAEISADMPDPLLFASRQVIYSVSRLALLGRIIWVGHLGTEPDEDLVFEVLASDGAKAASTRTPAWAT